MVNKFNRKELKRLGCSDNEIQIVLKYQKLLPMPDTDYELNARALHKYLGVGKDVSNWITGRIKKYDFKENIDYKITYESPVAKSGDTDFIGFTAIQLARSGIKIEYYLSVEMCKELCTIENNELGKLARRYFILMESVVKKNKEWWTIRNPQKCNYKPMCQAISTTLFNACGRYGDDSDFSREANIINRIATGCSALEIKNYLGVGLNDLTRDNLTNEYNEKIAFLQQQNILLLGMGMPIIQRVKMLISFFDIKYPDAKPLQNYYDRAYLISARKKIIEELER